MARRHYLIVTVNWQPARVWRRATAASMVREAGVPPCVAAAWAGVRRELSPAGLKRKLRDQVN